MPDTKPAGCAGQFFGCGFALVGAVLTLTAVGAMLSQRGTVTPSAEAGATMIIGFGLGLPLLIVGVWWYRRGLKPGQEAAAIRAAQAAAAARPMKRCHACAEEILAEARKCRHCGEPQP